MGHERWSAEVWVDYSDNTTQTSLLEFKKKKSNEKDKTIWWSNAFSSSLTRRKGFLYSWETLKNSSHGLWLVVYSDFVTGGGVVNNTGSGVSGQKPSVDSDDTKSNLSSSDTRGATDRAQVGSSKIIKIELRSEESSQVLLNGPSNKAATREKIWINKKAYFLRTAGKERDDNWQFFLLTRPESYCRQARFETSLAHDTAHCHKPTNEQ